MINLKTYVRPLLLIMAMSLLSVAALADFNPTNPPEPYVTQPLTVGVTPEEAGSASGSGKYMAGTTVTISTTGNENYHFQYWTINGYSYPDTTTTITYVMGDSAVSILAHYKYEEPVPEPWDPTNPPEPDLRLDVTVTVLSADTLRGTVSGGGTYPFATVDTITATPIPGYSFLYWQDGNTEDTRVIRAERDTMYIAYFGNDTVRYTETICYGTTLQVGDSIMDKEGHYEFFTTNADGLFVWNIVDLTIRPEVTSSHFDATFCANEPFHYEGVNYTQAGTYTRTLQNEWGCDSIVTFTLTENPSYDTLITAAICANERYQLHGFNVNTAGTHVQNLKTTLGCDSIIRLELTVYPTYDTTIVAHICKGDRYTSYGFDETTAGKYQQNLQSQHGCDSIVRLELIIDTIPIIQYYDTICDGETIRWHGQDLKTSGTYTYNESTTTNACGTIQYKMNLYVRPVLNMTFADVEYQYCDGSETIDYTIKSGSPVTYFVVLRKENSDFTWRSSLQTIYNGNILIPELPITVWPDQYTMTLTVHDAYCNEIQHNLTLYVNYPSDAIITQRWNDILAVRQSAYEYYKGFTSYQWYCNGTAIEGANQPILYKPEGLHGNTYQVEVTRAADGVKAISCSYTPTEEPNTSTLLVQPNMAAAKASVEVISPEVGNVSIINSMGYTVKTLCVERGKNIVETPEAAGVYLVHLVTPSGKKYVEKIIVY